MMCRRRYPLRCPYHQNQIETYYGARQHDEALEEYDTRGFPGDMKLRKESVTMITFKAFLVGGARWPR
jgi:hypothetical protein